MHETLCCCTWYEYIYKCSSCSTVIVTCMWKRGMNVVGKTESGRLDGALTSYWPGSSRSLSLCPHLLTYISRRWYPSYWSEGTAWGEKYSLRKDKRLLRSTVYINDRRYGKAMICRVIKSGHKITIKGRMMLYDEDISSFPCSTSWLKTRKDFSISPICCSTIYVLNLILTSSSRLY